MIRKVLYIMLCAFAGLGLAAGPAFAVKDFNIRNAGTYHFTVKGADGNIGIGSASPGQKLDVNGTVHVTGNVGIGTLDPQGAFVVTNGNVGIGTWVPRGALVVASGNVGIGTLIPSLPLEIVGASNYAVTSGSTPNGILRLSITSGSAQVLDFGAKAGGPGAWIQSNSKLNSAGLPLLINPNGGNVGIGTTGADSGRLIVLGGNVGIGSVTPGTPLDIQGTARMTAFTLSTGAAAGYVLQTNSVGVGTWVDAATLATNSNGWTLSGTNVYTATGSNNVGIGTTTPQGGLVVTNGNVGIGTWAVDGGRMIVQGGYVGIGTVAPGTALGVIGNVGIGSSAAAIVKLQVNTTPQSVDGMRLMGTNDFHYIQLLPSISSGGYNSLSGPGDQALIFSNSAQGTGNLIIAPWTASGIYNGLRLDGASGNLSIGTSSAVNKLTVAGGIGIGTGMNSPYLSNSAPAGGIAVEGNVGIGTTTPQGGLVVTNGNVGIGTWAPRAALDVQGTLAYFVGNIGIGTALPQSQFELNAGNASTGIRVMNTSNFPYIFLYKGDSGTSAKFFGMGGTYRGGTGGGYTLDFGTSAAGLSGALNNAYMSLVYGGNLGIGTTLPSSLLEVGAQKFNVTSAGNVGIGSVAPAQTLDIQGTARMTNFILSNSPAAGYVLQTNSVGVGTWVDAATLATSGGGWTAGSGNVYTTTGSNNVGIGTTTPQGGLVVTNGNVGIGTWESDGARLTVLGGNIGIGTRTPGNILDVYGNSNSATTGMARIINTYDSAFVPALEMLAPSLTANHQYYFSLGRDASTYNRASWAYNYVGNNSASNNMGFGFYGVGQLFTLQGNGNVGIGTTTPQGAFVVTNGNVGIGTWAPSTTLEVNGNVGIGTTNIAQQLSVSGSRAVFGWGPAGGATTAAFMKASTSYGIGMYVNGGTTPSEYIDTAGNIGVGTTTPQGSFVVTNGNVGIGTWAPANRLEVRGTIQATGNVAVQSGGVLTAGIDGGGRARPYSSSTTMQVTDFNGNGITVVDGGNVGIGTITAAGGNLIVGGSGNVGIGSAWPGVTLDVQGSIRASGTISGTINPSALEVTGQTTLNTSSGNTGIGTTLTGGNTAKLAVIGGNVGIGTITPLGGLVVTNGNVGIGSIAPTSALDVWGAIRSNGTYSATASVLSVGDGQYGFSSSGSQLYIWNTAGGGAGGFHFKTGASAESLTVNPSAIGIGTTTPQAALVVNNGNVGIGTWTAAGGSLIIGGNGNVGIGSAWPGVTLDVQGSIRASGTISGTLVPSTLEVTGQTTLNTSSGNTGIGTTLTGGNTARLAVMGGNVGIGTIAPQGALVVMNGSVGIGTWIPSTPLEIIQTVATSSGAIRVAYNGLSARLWSDGSNARISGNSTDSAPIVLNGSGTGFVGVGTTTPQTGFAVTSGNVGIGTWTASGGRLIVQGGNVGIGTVTPGAALDVNGAIRSTATGNSFISGNLGLGTTLANQVLSISGVVAHQWGAPIPTVSSCGTGPSIKGTDQAFEITVGTSASGCTATFAGTYNDAICTVSNQSASLVNAMTYTVSASAVTITQTNLSGSIVDVTCDFKN